MGHQPGRPVPEPAAAAGAAADSEDVLGAPYRAETLLLRPDEEGEAVATLVHRPADAGPGERAVLHVHGFADYFFQRPAADFWAGAGYDFYALDLRRYGRSLRPHHTPNYVADLRVYQEELGLAWQRVRARHDTVVLSAHSTGGLTVPLWLQDGGADAAALVLNSPWLDMHGDPLTRRVALPLLHRLGGTRPMAPVPRRVSGIYARSLHRDHEGEWDFDLAWKPLRSWPVHAGWIRAIRSGQSRLARGLDLALPVLVLCSARSGHPRAITDPEASSTDIVLDVEQIRRRAPLLSSHVTVAMIEGALHDVTLSAGPVRARVFEEIRRFLDAYVHRDR